MGGRSAPTHQEQLRAQKRIARRIIEEVIDGQNMAVADELIAQDYVEHNPTDGRAPGLAGFKEWIALAHAGFPDWQHSIEDLIAEGDRVVVRTVARGTHRGEFMGIPPTGRRVAEPGIDIMRIVDGKMVEHWGQYDWLRLFERLNAPAPDAEGQSHD